MRHSNLPASRGFTLVEVLVGLVLGLIAIVIMYQVFATFESQRRTSVAGGDAQSAGHLSLYSMERELRLAGLGLMYLFRDVDTYDSQSACPVGVSTYSAKSGVVTAAPGIPAVPVLVTDRGTGYGANSDSLVITYGPSAASGAPNQILANVGQGLALDKDNINAGIRVHAAPFIDTAAVPPKNAVFNKNDIIMVAQPASDLTLPAGGYKNCVRLKVSDVQVAPGSDPLKPDAVLKVDPGTAFDENPPAGTGGFFPATGYVFADLPVVIHLGTTLAQTEYKVDPATNQLTVGAPGAAATPIAEGVVSLQIQYGIGPKPGDTVGGFQCDPDATMAQADPDCQRIRAWADASGVYDGVDWSKLNTVPANMQQRLKDIKRIKAVRIAVVTRSQNLERDVLYGAAGSSAAIQAKATCTAGGDIVSAAGAFRVCAWADGTNPDGTASLAPRIDLTGMADWDRYRYRVYETMVPLRNVIWGSKSS